MFLPNQYWWFTVFGANLHPFYAKLAVQPPLNHQETVSQLSSHNIATMLSPLSFFSVWRVRANSSPHYRRLNVTDMNLRLSEGTNWTGEDFSKDIFPVCFHRSTARNTRTPGGSWRPPRRAEDYGRWSLCVSLTGLDFWIWSWKIIFSLLVPFCAPGLILTVSRRETKWLLKTHRVTDEDHQSIRFIFYFSKYWEIFCCQSFLLKQHLVFLVFGFFLVGCHRNSAGPSAANHSFRGPHLLEKKNQ